LRATLACVVCPWSKPGSCTETPCADAVYVVFPALAASRNGLCVTVHGSELAAWQAIKDRFCKYAYEKPLFDKHIAAGTFAELNDWLQMQINKGGIDSYSVEKHFLHLDDANSPVSDDPNAYGVQGRRI
jgi:hypothetical protein